MKRKPIFEPFPKAGPVTITRADGTTETHRAYNVAERARVVGGGTPEHRAPAALRGDAYVNRQKQRRLEHEADQAARTWKRKPYWM